MSNVVNNSTSASTSASTSWPIASILTIVFVVLKLTGVIDWSWWWVVSPLWISALFVITVLLILLIIIVIAETGKGRKK